MISMGKKAKAFFFLRSSFLFPSFFFPYFHKKNFNRQIKQLKVYVS